MRARQLQYIRQVLILNQNELIDRLTIELDISIRPQLRSCVTSIRWIDKDLRRLEARRVRIQEAKKENTIPPFGTHLNT